MVVKGNVYVFLVRAVICPPQLSDVRCPLRVCREIQLGGPLCARPASSPRPGATPVLHSARLVCWLELLLEKIGCPAARARAVAHVILAASMPPHNQCEIAWFALVRCVRLIIEQSVAAFDDAMPAVR